MTQTQPSLPPVVHDQASTGATLALIWLVLAFADETVRKGLESGTVLATALKDPVLVALGLLLWWRRPSLGRPLVPMVPWLFFAGASVLLTGTAGGPVFAIAAARTYVFLPLAAALLGAVVARRRPEMASLARLWLVLAIGACAVALLQDTTRSSLPLILQRRLYIERHPLAEADYVESVFASPQTFALVCITTFAYLLDRLFASSRATVRPAILAGLLAYGVYLSEIRTGLVMLVVLSGILLALRLLEGRPLAVSAFGITLLAAVWMLATEGEGLVERIEQRAAFHRDAFRWEEVEFRLRLPLLEFVETHRYDPTFLGEGAGQSGSLRQLHLQEDSLAAPFSHDSGLFMLVVEFGIGGTACFLLPFGIAVARGLGSRGGERAGPELAVLLVLLCWFLFKSHTIVFTGISSVIFFGHLGMLLAGEPDRDGPRSRSPATRALVLQGSRLVARHRE